MDILHEDITSADVVEHLVRFLPPGTSSACTEGEEYVVRWCPLPLGPIEGVELGGERTVRSRMSFDDAVHRLIGECAAIFLAYRRLRFIGTSVRSPMPL